MAHDGSDRRTDGVTVSPLGRGDEGQWDAFVEAMPEATFCHLSGWRTVVETVFGHRTHYLMARQGGSVVGVLPLTHVRSFLFGNALISNAFCMYGGPVAVSEQAYSALEREAISISERIGADYLELRMLQPRHADWPRKADLYVTFRKSMHAEVDANMKAIPRKQRAMVRKGIANGLRSEIDGDPSRLHHIYAESVRNLGTPVFPLSLFRALKRQFGEACDIVTICQGELAVASVMNFYFRDQVMPYYGGGLPAARDLAANDFMYWEVMRRACERGYRFFDFGRSKVGTGSYNFKRYWGFEPAPLVYEYQLGKARGIPDNSPRNRKFHYFIEIWKRLPLPLTKLIGPIIVKGTG